MLEVIVKMPAIFMLLTRKTSEILPTMPCFSSSPTPLVLRKTRSFFTAITLVTEFDSTILCRSLNNDSTLLPCATYRITELTSTERPSSEEWLLTFATIFQLFSGSLKLFDRLQLWLQLGKGKLCLHPVQ